MKEELLEIKNLTNEYSEAKKNFEEKKAAFDENTKETMVVLSDCVIAANYTSACEFYEEYKTLIEIAKVLKAEHPRYGEKRVLETLVESFKNVEEYKDRILCAYQIVSAYLTFEKCGFTEVKTAEQHVKDTGLKLAEKVDTVKTEKIDTTVDNFNKVTGVVRENAEKVAGIVNKGAKRLIKYFEEKQNKNN